MDKEDLSRLVENYIKELFDKRELSQDQRKAMWQYYYDTLSAGVDKGYSSTMEEYDPKLAHDLKYNIAEFSAFKETSFKAQLESAMVKDGKLLPWNEFKKKADELNIAYNRTWLKTEYHQTVAAANSAEKYQEYLADEDLYPNLKYIAVLDSRVRDEHKAWNGLTLPIKHEFWSKHLPPNDWGCRCSVEQSDDPVSSYVPSVITKSPHDNNPAISGKIFKENAYEKGLSESEKVEAKDNLKDYINSERKNTNKELLNWFSNKYNKKNPINIKNSDFKNNLTISKSNIENVLKHIPIVENKYIIKDFELILKDAKFIEYKELINKDSINYGKKIGRGVIGYNTYETLWNKQVVRIVMEVMKFGNEQPYSINFIKK